MRAEDDAGVLRARVALEVALEQVADRRRDGDRRTEKQRVRAAEPVLVQAGEPHAGDGRDHADRQAFDGLVRGDRRRERHPAEQAPAEVGARVADERPDHHVDDEVAPVGKLSQQHRVRERHADPEDAHQRHRDRRCPAARLEERQPEGQRHDQDQREHEMIAVAEVGGDHQSDQPEEARQPRRVRLRVHRVELVQADEAEADQERRERRPARDDEEQRDGCGGDADHDALLQVGRAARRRRAERPRRGGAAVPPCGHDYRPPKRRARWPKAPRARSKASAVKSGHNSAAKTSSEYALCQSRKFESRSSPEVRMTTSGSCMSGA